MAQTIKLKRSAQSGASGIPSTSDLALGEVGINTYHGKMYIKKDDGTESIVEVGSTASFLPLSGGSLTGNLSLGDNVKLQLGNQTNGDLQIYSDGTNGVLKNTNGNYILLDSDNLAIRSQAGSNRVIVNSSGINVTGSVVADEADIGEFSTSTNVFQGNLGGTGARLRAIVSSYSNPTFSFDNDTDTGMYTAGANTLNFTTGGVQRIRLDSAGDISFYDSAGSSQNFYWDSSTSRLGLGVTNPANKLEISGGNIRIINQSTGRITFNNGSTEAYFGFNGAGSSTLDSGSQPLQIQAQGSNHIQFDTNSAERLKINADGSSVFSGAVSATTLNVGATAQTVGSASSPAFTLGDTDTGFYRDGYNRVQISAAGQEVAKFDSSGNVNIGSSLMVGSTTAPDASLRIDNESGIAFKVTGGSGGANLAEFTRDVGGTATVAINASHSRPQMSFAATGNTFAIGTGDSGFEIADNSVLGTNTRLTIDSSGRVGIGTNSPDALLRIDQDSAVTALKVTGGNSGVALAEFTRDVGASGTVTINAASGDPQIKFESPFNTFSIGTNGASFEIADSAALGTNPRLTIDSSGNVIIPNGGLMVGATTAPTAPLTVSGADGTLAVFTNASDADFQFKTASAVATITPSTGTLAFGTSNTERMRIDSSGRLLVGLTGASGFGQLETTTLATEGQCILARVSDSVLVGTTSRIDLGKVCIDAGTGSNGLVVDVDDATGYTNLLLDRTASDGTFIAFNRGSTNTGSIQSRAGLVSTIVLDPRSGQGAGLTGAGAGGDTLRHITPTNESGVEVNGKVSLGNSFNGFRDLYLSNKVYAAYIGAGSDTDTSINFDTANTIKMFTGGQEAARITSGGTLLVGTTGLATYASTVNEGVEIAPDFIGVSRDQNTVMHLNRLTNDGTIVDFRTAGFVRGSVSISGSTTSYNTSSDERLKDNIVDAPTASKDIDAIQVRSFDWKADGEHQKYGMVAQELLEVAPDAVTKGDTPDDMMGVDYSKLIPMLIKEIQSLRQRVAQLEE